MTVEELKKEIEQIHKEVREYCESSVSGRATYGITLHYMNRILNLFDKEK